MSNSSLSQEPGSKKTFVLVHAAWHGAWIWRRVSDRLIERGHRVFTPSLTGSGERVHLQSPGIDLDTQITDVVNVMKWGDLEDVVLCGHSYAGFVISGVAEQMESAISSIVFLEAFMPENGQALVDLVPRDQVRAYVELAEIGQAAPPIPANAFGINPRDVDWVDRKLTGHPAKCFTQRIALTGARDRIPKKAFIWATGWMSLYRVFYDRVKDDPTWRTYEVPCGHDVMIDMPDRLVEILEEVS